MKSAVEMRKYTDDCFNNLDQISRMWAKRVADAEIAPIAEEFAGKGCDSCLIEFNLSDLDEFQYHALHELLDGLGYKVVFNSLLNSIKISW